jgi:hypothetical protein
MQVSAVAGETAAKMQRNSIYNNVFFYKICQAIGTYLTAAIIKLSFCDILFIFLKEEGRGVGSRD